MKLRIITVFGLLVIAGMVWLAFLLSRPEAEWNSSPDTLIIEVAHHGFEIDYNYIPNVRIWGNGRLVWVEYENESFYGKRRIMEGQLTPEELRDIITQFIEAGFFDWRLSDFLSAGLASTSLTVNLLNDSEFRGFENHEISEELRELSDYLMGGAGAEGVEFVPTRGFLTTYIARETGCGKLETKYQWPKESFGYDLEEIQEYKNGVWAEGDDLAFAWQIVNENPDCPLVESDGTTYMIFLIIPKLSYFKLPVE